MRRQVIDHAEHLFLDPLDTGHDDRVTLIALVQGRGDLNSAAGLEHVSDDEVTGTEPACDSPARVGRAGVEAVTFHGLNDRMRIQGAQIARPVEFRRQKIHQPVAEVRNFIAALDAERHDGDYSTGRSHCSGGVAGVSSGNGGRRRGSVSSR